MQQILLGAGGAALGSGEMVGTMAMAFAAAGSLKGAAAVAAATAATFATAGSLKGAGVLAGAVPMMFTTSGNMAAPGAMQGALAMTFALTGTLVDAAPVVALSPRTVYSGFGDAASIFFETDGSLTEAYDAGSTNFSTEWLNPNPNSGQAALYEIQRTQVSGTIASFTGTLSSGVWYPLTSRRGVTVVAGATASRSNTSNYAIRRASDGVVLVSDVQITVLSDPPL